jgi:hypothetical protein
MAFGAVPPGDLTRPGSIMTSIDIIAKTCLLPDDVPDRPSGDETPQIVVLWGGVTEPEVAAFLISLAKYNQFPECRDFWAIGKFAAQSETLILAGGIRIVSNENAILPGCCCGLESWREQLRALEGYPAWLGHDPAPWSEVVGDEVQFWPDGGIGKRRSDFQVRIVRSEVPELQKKLTRDMEGFLYALRRWSRSLMDPRVADSFAAKLDSAWQISNPS